MRQGRRLRGLVAGVLVGGVACGIAPASARALDVAVAGGTLVVTAGPGETNVVAVTSTGAEVRVTDPGGGVGAAGPGCRALPDVAHAVACDATPVSTISVDLADGQDRVEIDSPLPATLLGGPGDDVLVGGAAGDTLVGGLGSDLLVGRGGVDVVRYDDGAHEAGVNVSLSGGANDGGFGEDDDVRGVEGVVGTGGDDRVLGSDAAESFAGGPGDDVAQLGGGDDAFAGGAGDDRCVQPTEGSDICDGGPGNDLLLLLGTTAVRVTLDGVADDGPAGATGNVVGVEEVIAGEGSDLVVGGPGPETLSGRGGDDVVLGGGGDDLLSGDSGDDVLRGGPGRDRVTYASVFIPGPITVALDGRPGDGAPGERDSVGKDVEEVDGTLTGDDVLVGGRTDGPARLTGFGGADTLVGSRRASDVVDGGGGADRIAVLDGRRDTVRCGSGRDEVIADAVDVTEDCESRVVVRPTVPDRWRPARSLPLTWRCPRRMRLAGSATLAACRGTVTVEVGGRPAGRLARARVRIPAGRRRAVVLRLSTAALARARSASRVAVVTRLDGVPGVVHRTVVRVRRGA